MYELIGFRSVLYKTKKKKEKTHCRFILLFFSLLYCFPKMILKRTTSPWNYIEKCKANAVSASPHLVASFSDVVEV